jgi:8-oxo-dGTP pyrophosphatase MutT (NUDIX family)
VATHHRITSAGGIALRRRNRRVELLTVKTTRGVEPQWQPALLQLPKGGVANDETLEQTAIREVLEETGYQGQVLGKAGTACWTYSRGDKKFSETVHYYFMKVPAAPSQPHDTEFDEICWLHIDKACQQLSYPEERDLINRVVNSKALPY